MSQVNVPLIYDVNNSKDDETPGGGELRNGEHISEKGYVLDS